MHVVAVPDPRCPGCLGDGRCWVCLGTGRLGHPGAPELGCHVCSGSGDCASCPVVVDLIPAQDRHSADMPVRG